MADIAVSVSLERLKCNEQEDTELPLIDTEDDEPYVLVMSINGQGRGIGPGGVVQLPESRVFRVGPIEGFDKDDLKPAPSNALWGLNPTQAAIPEPAPIPDIDQVFFLVSLLENDNAEPAEVENRIVAFAQAGLPGLWLEAQARNDLDERSRFELFVETARKSMDGVIDLARLNPLDPDDKIGLVQVLRFSDQEHQGVLNRSIPVVERTLQFQGDDADYELTFALKAKAPAIVAANPQDKWILTMGNRVLVITNDGRVFVHDITDNTIGTPFQLAGSPVAFNPQDKWVLVMGNRILVIVNDGRVFAHDITGNTIGTPFQLAGSPVAFNPQDKWVLVMGNRILVIVNDGRVFAHDITGNTIGTPFQLS